MMTRPTVMATALLFCLSPLLCAAEPEFSVADLEFFEKQVRPLLVDHCYECHSGKSKSLKGGLRLDHREHVLAGGDTGPAAVPGDLEESLLIDAVRYGDLYQMPPKYKLKPEQVAIFERWVERGVPWPQESVETPGGRDEFDLQARRESHWAWKPIADPVPPEVSDGAWPRDPLDRFVLARLEQAGLSPAEDVDPRRLVRRLYFDLTGLPPEPAVVDRFAADPTEEALKRLVDDLLESPHFGERWGRHWLDLMRYAESRGHEFDYNAANAWQYRDYVIRAFNANVPYDQFLMEHLAGDLLPEPRRHPSEGFNESILGTGFWFLGEWVHSPVDIRQDEMDRMDNAVDVFSKTFLGLTVACARCHDHKFDAISQHDYYALVGFLQSSAYRQVRFETLEHNREIAAAIGRLDRETQKLTGELTRGADGELSDAKSIARMLTAATDAWAAGVRPQAENPSDSERAAIGERAEQAGVDAERLAAWIAELLKAEADPSHPLHAVALAAGDWNKASQWLGEAPKPWQLPPESRVAADFGDPEQPWLVDGPAFGDGPIVPGELLADPGSDSPRWTAEPLGRARLMPEFSKLELKPGSQRDPGKMGQWDRSGKTLRTPTFELSTGKAFYLIRGAAWVQAVVDSHRTLNGPLHGNTLAKHGPSAEWRWIEHRLERYRGHRIHVEFSPVDDHPLEVALVVVGDASPPLPPDRASVIRERLQGAGDLSALIESAAQSIQSATTSLDGQASAEQAIWRAWASSSLGLWGGPAAPANKRWQAYRQRRRQLVEQIQLKSHVAPAMWDGTAEDEFLLIRGNSRNPGDQVPRRQLEALGGEPIRSDGSGRLELARELLSPDNPFPSRVMANRIWHHLTGRGIVPSVDNFGVLGQPPTHPLLLDHLAQRFRRDGWDVKGLIRSVVLSRTYRMSSRVDPRASELDPMNNLLHHMPVRRLQGEAIRDAMLALSGRLDRKQFGPSVPVHLTEFMQGRGRPQQGPLDGAGRRSIYLSVRRNFLSPMMLAFDTPQPTTAIGDRTVSNVPAQALILLNDPLVIDQARGWAERLAREEPQLEGRIQRMYYESLSRPPSDQERSAAKAFLAEQARNRGLTGDPAESALHIDVWTDLCHVMFNVKEFIYLP